MNIKEAKIKLESYCAYQERSQMEARKKLNELGLYGDDAEELIVDLIASNFLNEERFAKSFIGGKFRIKRWGKNKILSSLRQHDISDYCIKVGMKEIEKEEYLKVMEKLIITKNETLQEDNIYIKRNKIAKSLIARGFEPEMIWVYLKQHIL